jgi:hypothetical protein
LALVAFSTDKDIKAKAFTMVGILDILSVMLGRPAMAAFYSIGLTGNKAFLGLPFAVSAVGLCVLAKTHRDDLTT